MQPKYKIYATLLDSYFNYLNSAEFLLLQTDR